MTREQAKELWPIVKAFGEGKKIQCRWKKVDGDGWDDVDNPGWSDACDYRIAPESKLRPWRPEEVPVGAITRTISTPHIDTLLILGTHINGVYLGGDIGPYDYPSLLKFREYSLDHGKTWQPCGVME